MLYSCTRMATVGVKLLTGAPEPPTTLSATWSSDSQPPELGALARRDVYHL